MKHCVVLCKSLRLEWLRNAFTDQSYALRRLCVLKRRCQRYLSARRSETGVVVRVVNRQSHRLLQTQIYQHITQGMYVVLLLCPCHAIISPNRFSEQAYTRQPEHTCAATMHDSWLKQRLRHAHTWPVSSHCFD